MSRIFFTYVILGVVQVFVLNRISLFGCATPLLYIYLILPFRRNYPKWIIILCGFIMGLSMDIFTNTPGVAAASATFLAFIQPLILNLFVQKDSADDMQPTMKVLGTRRYVYYTLICVFIYCLLFFTLETFNFFNWQQWLLNIGGSTVLTALLIIVIENMRKR